MVKFGEKLDFLMNITNTNNSALSLGIKLDASYISRLRRGQRGALKNAGCIKNMASYFARRCQMDYQKKAVSDAMELDCFLSDEAACSEAIAGWLRDEQKSSEVRTVGSFLDRLSNAASSPAVRPFHSPEKTSGGAPTQVSVYYGEEGKRQCAVCFLSAVIAQSKPRTLLLYSDEPIDWMTANREFTAEWASLMFQAIEQGNRIKIIHTISRNLDEMLSAINQWMPLYMTGAIEPFFYPKTRDGIFRQTLFIAPETAAVLSSSVGDMLGQEATVLLRDERAVKACETEFFQYLKLCKPLMRIFTDKDKKAYFDALLEFEKGKSDSIIKTESLSLLTMPDAVVSSMASRAGGKMHILSDYQNSRCHLFENNLKTNRFSEIIRLPDIQTAITPNRVKAAFSVVLSSGAVYYTLREYILHLQHLVYLLQSHHNFHIYLTEGEQDDRYMVYAREDLGVIVAKTSLPPVALGINEINMTGAFWVFFSHMIGEKNHTDGEKAKTVRRLTAYIESLKQYE